MVVVLICSDLGAPKIKVSHCFHCFPIYLQWSDETKCHDLHSLNVKFKPDISLSYFTFIKRLFSSFSISSIRVVSSEYLRLLIFKYTEELYKKDLHDPDNHNGVITHLEPDILECEVKWALGSINMNKASRGDRIPVELFQILKNDAVKVLHSVCQQVWKTQQWPQDWKRSVFIPIPKKGNAKNFPIGIY